MCGIVGYVGKREAAELLVDGLRRMEYRGYDSAGIACLDDAQIAVVKQPGKVKALRLQVDENDSPVMRSARMGIGHTRWATHGAPTEVNAHPHLDAGEDVVMVHNGIIENYREIRSGLEQQGVMCVSQTDSEVLVQLIAYCFKGNLEEAVSEALRKVKGTYGILVMSSQDPSKMVAARCGSPIVIGLGEQETVVASDSAAIMPYTRDVIYLEDFDMAVIDGSGVKMLDIQHAPVNRAVTAMDWEENAAEKDAKRAAAKAMEQF